MQPIDAVMEKAQASTRFSLLLIGTFAVIAALLAGVGLYGVLATVVRQRTAEIGVRMTLGAQPSNIFQLVVGQGLRLTAIGIVAGLIAAFILTRGMTTMLVGVKAADPATYSTMAVLFIIIAAMVSWLPAWRRQILTPPLLFVRSDSLRCVGSIGAVVSNTPQQVFPCSRLWTPAVEQRICSSRDEDSRNRRSRLAKSGAKLYKRYCPKNFSARTLLTESCLSERKLWALGRAVGSRGRNISRRKYRDGESLCCHGIRNRCHSLPPRSSGWFDVSRLGQGWAKLVNRSPVQRPLRSWMQKRRWITCKRRPR